MKLADLFVTEAMDLSLPEMTKDETLNHLASRFNLSGGVSDVVGYVERLQAREAQSTTGVGDEIAIPHAQHESIQEAAIVFGRSNSGIEWESFDEQPAKLIFMIAAPEGGGGEHLQALASLSSVLMNPDAKSGLLSAQTPSEVIDIIRQFDKNEQEADAEETVASVESNEDEYVLAVTACPTGIAHTYMAEEKLIQAAKAQGVNIKVETNGQSGIGNRLTRDDINRATAIIVAADKQVEMARFNGKPVIITKVADGINKADELVTRATKADAPIYRAANADENAELADDGEGESLGRQIYKHLMNGVSHMLPFVVAGGILIAISFFWGINSADPSSPEYSPIAQALNTMGSISFAMMLPMLAGYIGQSLADRMGLVLGIVGGLFANPSILTAFNTELGVFEGASSSGFLGALVAGFLAGGVVWLLRKAFSWMPKSLEGMKTIFLFPVLGVAIMGLLMLFVINGPMSAVMTGLVNLIDSIPREASVLLGFVVAAMMSIDMGGPINKAAYVTGTALVTEAGGAGSDVMAAVMIGGMVPPLAIALSATINKNLYPKAQHSSAMVNYVLGAAFITEGAIPFAAINPLKVIPSLAIGSGVAGALSMFFGSVSYVPHGGVFAVLANGVTNPIMFLVSWLIGGLVGALLLVWLLNPKNEAVVEEK
ncbi:PTS sugar transporter subunit IIA [Aerococcaceae bacterium DSM 111022]|nr:PTS sugar transporter subunit IIA [Aerococcaceae bacterium DSM 111022]